MKPILTLFTALFVALSVPAMAANVELANDPATGGAGKFAAGEIRRAATAKGVTLGDDAHATRVALTVKKDAETPATTPRAVPTFERGRVCRTISGTSTSLHRTSSSIGAWWATSRK